MTKCPFNFPLPRGTLVQWVGKGFDSVMTKGKIYVVGGEFYNDYMMPGGRYYDNDKPYIVIEQADNDMANGWPWDHFESAGGPW